jgi:hypothetical protein
MRRAWIFGITGIALLTLFLWSMVYGQTGSPPPIRLTELFPATIETCSCEVRVSINGQGFVPPNDSAPWQNQRAFAGYTPGSTQFPSSFSYSAATSATVTLWRDALEVPGVLYITIYSPFTGYSNSLPLSVVSTPVLTGMIPAVAPPGTTFVARISGGKLSRLDSVKFSGAGITAKLLGGGEDWMRFVEVTVPSSATRGSYGVTVTATGRTTSMASVLTVKPPEATTTPSSQPLPIPDVETGPLKTGYVIVTTDGPQGADPLVSMNVGTVRDGVVQSQAAIAGTSRATTRATLGIDIDTDLGRNFGIAIVNTSPGSSSVNLTLVDERGVSISQTKTISMGEFSQISNFVSELFPSGALGTSFRGSLILTTPSLQSFIALGLRFNGPYFFPVSAGSTNIAGLSTTLKTRNSSGGELPTATVFPQFAMGGGWATQISIVDAKGASATGRIAWFDKDGQPTNVTMNGETASVFQYTVPPNGAFLLAPRDAHGQTPF